MLRDRLGIADRFQLNSLSGRLRPAKRRRDAGIPAFQREAGLYVVPGLPSESAAQFEVLDQPGDGFDDAFHDFGVGGVDVGDGVADVAGSSAHEALP